MALVYDTEQIYTGPPINIHNLDPVKQWKKHYGNYKYLKFIFDNTKSGLEKRQANQEMQIATRKMNRWEGMSKAYPEELGRARKEIDDQWSGK